MPYVYVEDEPQEEEVGKPAVRLSGTDGNVFALMGEVKRAMYNYQKEVDSDYNAKYMFDHMFEEIQQGDYDNALQVMMQYCEVC